MSVTSAPGAPPVLDFSDTPPVPFTRLVRVEARKMVDTRAGFWLLVATGVLLVAVVGIVLLVVGLGDFQPSAGTFGQILTIPLSLLLPVIAITSLTSEWGQRTNLVSFTHEPHRARVVWAKLITVLGLALATIAVAVVLGAIGTAVAASVGGFEASWDLEASTFGWTLVSQLLFFVMAFAFATLLLSSPLAIALYYVVAVILPLVVYGPIVALTSWGADVVPWIDLNTAMGPLFLGAGGVDGTVYAQVAVTTLIWVIAPLIAGFSRILRAEVK